MSKKAFLLALTMLFFGAAMAQDVITLKNGDEINGKVTKVTSTEIEYKLATNPDGPTYTKPVTEIFMVKYENGQKDVFNNTPAPATQQQQVTVDIPTGVTLERSRGEIVDAATNRTFSEFELQQMLGMDAYNDYVKARDSYKSIQNSLAWSYTFLFGGALMYGIGVWFNSLDINGTACIVVGAIWFVAGNIMIPVDYITRGVAAGKISRIAEGYNARNGRSDLSLSFGATVLPSADGGVAPRVGLSLKF